MDDSLESVDADGWHPQDVILVAQALKRFTQREDVSEARATRAYALLFGLIDTANIPYEHTDFDGFDHLSDMADTALSEWMENQADESWGEELLLDQ